MKIFIDADGCPVVDIAVRAARHYGLECTLICDTAHSIQRDGAETIIVDKGADSADFRLVNLVSAGDIAITQDYGLAGMCLSRRALVLNQDGKQYTDWMRFGQLYGEWRAKHITGRDFMRRMDMSANTFYRRVREYEIRHGITEQTSV